MPQKEIDVRYKFDFKLGVRVQLEIIATRSERYFKQKVNLLLLVSD